MVIGHVTACKQIVVGESQKRSDLHPKAHSCQKENARKNDLTVMGL